ncbi:hypothetical protein VST7929_01508 [Vibrio stylophorae]|uniref:Aspartate kinase n=1 Tax=Vibrio stylophorae TaxID=659351 RepID=A0ABN8DW97_9VIBR|nr:ACT domain-containing protein [Vibrio stylophorae]CAH0533637.1 hypothetical protein VST7929_01508 [Vibrio stylophorae]
MVGETNLNQLLASMAPSLDNERYGFITMLPSNPIRHVIEPKATYFEQEGLTMIVPHAQAMLYGFEVEAWFHCITLTVHSSLEAVGLTAAVSSALAKAGISANVLAAYFHDHIYVPESRSEEAMRVLHQLAEQANFGTSEQ